jgi:hypothetical protein
MTPNARLLLLVVAIVTLGCTAMVLFGGHR